MGSPTIAETAPVLCLASASPRRSALLDQIGIGHVCLATDIDESVVDAGDAGERVREVARAKAREGMRLAAERGLDGLPVLAADTAVVLGRRELGKPRDRAEAVAMLMALSGRSHWVYTAVVLNTAREAVECLGSTRVRFRDIAPAEIERYCDSGEPFDKAGAYGIQGRAAVFVNHLEGSYSNVVGLPLFETWELLAATGVVK